MIKKQQGNTLLVIIVTITTLGLLGALGFIFWQNFMGGKASTVVTTSQNPTNATTTVPSKKTFVSKKQGITFTYNSDYTIKEDDSALNEGASKATDLHTIQISVYDKNDKQVASISSDFQGGFACDQTGATFFATNRDGEKLNMKYAPVAYFSATIHGNTTAGYTVQYGLSETEPNPTMVESPCADSTNAGYVAGVHLDKSAPLLIFSVAFQSVGEHSFKTLNEAEAYLKSDAYTNVRDMIRSFNFQ